MDLDIQMALDVLLQSVNVVGIAFCAVLGYVFARRWSDPLLRSIAVLFLAMGAGLSIAAVVHLSIGYGTWTAIVARLPVVLALGYVVKTIFWDKHPMRRRMK